MVTILAKQAVQTKCRFENARMTGNYECAYALGILTFISGNEEVAEIDSIINLKSQVIALSESFTTEDEQLNRMIEIIKEYEPSDVIDNQMRELYTMGFQDKKL